MSSSIVTAGVIYIKATHVGEDTSIATIIRLVDEASNSKAPISKLVDKISGIFVPIIMSIAVITLITFLLFKYYYLLYYSIFIYSIINNNKRGIIASKNF